MNVLVVEVDIFSNRLYKFESVYKHAQVVEQTIFDSSDVSLVSFKQPVGQPGGS